MKDLNALSNESLIAKLNEIRLDLAIEKRKVVSTGVASKKVKTREMKRTIAQIQTLLKQRGAKY
ncbi:MAG: 50S ribosomal protein L29 [Candidatus Micrarchaeia archaeon]